VEQIEAEFRLKAREFHPDKNDNPDSTFQFQAINRAKQVLTDPKLRRQYECWKSSGLNIPFERANHWFSACIGVQCPIALIRCYHLRMCQVVGLFLLPYQPSLVVSSGHGPFAAIEEHNPSNSLLSQFRAYKI
ncbi:DnaJ domain protein, partial [Opisthorchis viverrini]